MIADLLERPVPVVESITSAPAVTYTALAPVIKHVFFAPDDPGRIDCVAPCTCDRIHWFYQCCGNLLLLMSLGHFPRWNRSPSNKLCILKPENRLWKVSWWSLRNVFLRRLKSRLRTFLFLSVCYIAPSPVIYVAPPPAATHAATRFALSTNASDRTRDARDDSSTCRRNTCSSDRICDACTHDRVELFLRFLFISCQMLAMTLLVW